VREAVDRVADRREEHRGHTASIYRWPLKSA